MEHDLHFFNIDAIMNHRYKKRYYVMFSSQAHLRNDASFF